MAFKGPFQHKLFYDSLILNDVILNSNNSLWYYDTEENAECETSGSTGG